MFGEMCFCSATDTSKPGVKLFASRAGTERIDPARRALSALESPTVPAGRSAIGGHQSQVSHRGLQVQLEWLDRLLGGLGDGCGELRLGGLLCPK